MTLEEAHKLLGEIVQHSGGYAQIEIDTVKDCIPHYRVSLDDRDDDGWQVGGDFIDSVLKLQEMWKERAAHNT
jgi:hypothetical protein